MELSSVDEWQLYQNRLTELVARLRNMETAAFQVANGHTRSVRIDEVANLAATVGQNGRLVFAVEKLAVSYQETGGDSVAKRLRLEIL